MAMLAAAWIAGCDGPDGGAPKVVETVEMAVSPVETRHLTRRLRVTGTLLGDEETTIAAKVSGRIVEVLKDLGDKVAPGAPLIRVDPTDYVLAREERARAFAQTLARLGVETLPGEKFDISVLPAIVRARLQAENARARYERGKKLSERVPPLISQQDYADLQTTWQVAESNLQVERLTVAATLAEGRTLQAQLSVAEQRLQDTLHRAPVPGAEGHPNGSLNYEVAERRVTLGDFVLVGTPLFRLVDPDPIRFRAQAPERRMGIVKLGQKCRVHVDAYPRTFEGTVARVSPAVDVQTRMFTAEIRIPNAQGLLKPGSFATAEIEVGTEPALVIPGTAVVSFAGVHKAFRVKEGRAEERRLTLGERMEGAVEVVAGLEKNDVVVVSPSSLVSHGTPIRASTREGRKP